MAGYHIYSSRAPSKEYAETVARLLLGTSAHESSGFRFRRQIARWDDGKPQEIPRTKLLGAWGLWQCEDISIRESLRQLNLRDLARRNANQFLLNHAGMALKDFAGMTRLKRMQAIAHNDWLALCFARLHYLWVPSAVPISLEEQAHYWKRHYNTSAGAGQPQDFIRAWREHVEAHVCLE